MTTRTSLCVSALHARGERLRLAGVEEAVLHAEVDGRLDAWAGFSGVHAVIVVRQHFAALQALTRWRARITIEPMRQGVPTKPAQITSEDVITLHQRLDATIERGIAMLEKQSGPEKAGAATA